MSIKQLESYNAFGKINSNLQEIVPPSQQQNVAKKESFGDIMSEMIKEVGDSHKSSNKMLEQLVTGDSSVTVHDAMIAMQKADVAFQLMNRVRAKLVRAYEEIIRTPV
jgi:flagellar hook-basal body complex protein FliE